MLSRHGLGLKYSIGWGTVAPKRALTKLSELIVGECSNPDIQKNFDGSDLLRIPFRQHCVI